MSESSYNQSPFVAVPHPLHECVVGWEKIADELHAAIQRRRTEKPIVVVDCYPGVDEFAVLNALQTRLAPKLTIHAADAYHSPEQIDKITAPLLGEPETSKFSNLSLVNFFKAEPLWRFRRTIDELKGGLVLIAGCGASLIAWGDVLVYADLTRREAQLRLSGPETGNLGAEKKSVPANLKYKRALLVDWPISDRWKRPLIKRWDYVLDTNRPDEPKLADAEDVRCGLRAAAARPFRLIPLWDGGRSQRECIGEDPSLDGEGKSSQSFECAPEENSLLLGLGDSRFEIPAIDLVFYQPRALLGQSAHIRFGAKFPIRFGILDTTDTCGSSAQVDPLTDCRQPNFGIQSTDKSYYILDAAERSNVYLGQIENADRVAMERDIGAAPRRNERFPAGIYANEFPAHKHDHFIVPAAIAHGCGAGLKVLEIGVTPHILAFKIRELARLGLERNLIAANTKQFTRTEPGHDKSWTQKNLVNHVESLSHGNGWRQERTGLQEGSFIETHRHWFSKTVTHDTHGSVNVLTLVEGAEAIVESPNEAFEPFVVRYGETFIVPAAVRHYNIRPHGTSTGKEIVTIKAFVRAQTFNSD